jgi:hypothetical protein
MRIERLVLTCLRIVRIAFTRTSRKDQNFNQLLISGSLPLCEVETVEANHSTLLSSAMNNFRSFISTAFRIVRFSLKGKLNFNSI